VYIAKLADGSKRVEARLLKRRIAPFARIATGDRVYLKPVGKPVSHVATAGWVRQIEGLTPDCMQRLCAEYKDDVAAPDEFWESRRDARHAVLVRLAGVREVRTNHPVHDMISAARAQNPRSAWLTLETDPILNAA
jgi:hypothetical protein